MANSSKDCRVYDSNNKLIREIKGKGDDVLHFGNFIQSIREGTPLKSEIEDGQRSTLLCHLGNIAWRSGHTINFDCEKNKIVSDKSASTLWSRSYRHGWEPKV